MREYVKDLWIETREDIGKVTITFIKVEGARQITTGVVFYVKSCQTVSTSELIHREVEKVHRR